MGHIGSGVSHDKACFIHETALLYGRITLGENVSVFPHTVMRAETHEIQINARTNIQDFVMVHVGDFTTTHVGEDCSITHRATLHGCEIRDRCLIGIGATIMDGAKIGENSIVAGHAFVQQGETFSANSIIAGIPAKKIGERDNSGRTLLNARVYEMIAANYANGIDRLSDEQLATILSQVSQ
ncbi:gamma carbonic anhydrase family protein [Parasphingorhabdus sp. DH2-15]|uniref:gamma carbonic anhydrase family protein n=1 Tax=Parasphingorhabdus sp. DH2-15 TaxID=3444112 RepID=UPI003F682B06